IQSTKGAINPTLQQGSSKQFNSVAIALKAGSAGTAPSGIRVVHLIHNWVPANPGNTFTLQTPSTGNLLVLQWIGISGCDITAVPDSNHNNYASTGPKLGNDSGGSSGDLQTFYVGSALTSTSLRGPAITVANSASCGASSNALIYDIAGAAASPYDSIAGRPT